MITCDNGVFLLKTDAFSALFRVSPHGQLEHLHFGAPVEASDAAALACKPGLGWGGAIAYDESKGTCLDVLPWEWSGAGRGDFRESPICLEEGPTDFCYAAHRIHRGIAPMTTGLPQARGEAETLEITLRQTDGLELTLYWTLFGGVLTRRAVLKNGTAAPVHVTKLMSFCLDLPGCFTMTTLDGGWIAEAHRHDTPVGPARVVNESVTGFSSNRHNPGFLLWEDAGEDHGRVYGFNLVWSGNHYSAAQQSLQGLTRVMGGVSPDHFRRTLQPGECLETPEAVLAWSDKGFNGLSRQMHDFVNGHIVPPAWQYRERPIVFNSWEGCGFDFTQNRLVELARQAAGLGCELFVLDDGWFGRRKDDRAGLGDYWVNKKKLPEGLAGLAEKIRAQGLEFGLWFEPEAVNPDSDLYRAHPDWALTDGLPPLLGRHELLLDLTKPEVRDYIVENVSAVLDSAPISYVKWDMNRHSVALGAKAYDYILGLYEVLGRIFGPRPEILLESCSSGGNRFDLGMLCFGPQIWCSDDTDPIERLDIQGGLSYLYPQSTFGAHVSAAPHAQTLRTTPLSTRGNVSFFGCLGYELDLKNLLPVEEVEIRNQTEFYKANRLCFQFGRFSRQSAADGTVWQVSREGKHIAGVFHRLQHAAPGYERLRMTGLKPGARYRVTSRLQKLRVGQFGGLVSHISPIPINPNGLLLRTADRRYGMEDGQEQFTASGAALLSGVMLQSRFTGTGYDKTLRLQGDFSAYLYIAEEETP